MSDFELIEKAIEIAVDAHKGQNSSIHQKVEPFGQVSANPRLTLDKKKYNSPFSILNFPFKKFA